MAKVAVESAYVVDIIDVPEYIAKNIRKYQRSFDKWLYDKQNDHGLWVIADGKKTAVSFGTQDFVDYLNEYVLSKDDSKCSVIGKGLRSVPEGMPSIWF